MNARVVWLFNQEFSDAFLVAMLHHWRGDVARADAFGAYMAADFGVRLPC